MTTAAERLAAIDEIPATELCQRALDTLNALVAIMNEETMLLRAGRAREASPLSAQKTSLAQDYTTLVRSIQRQTARLLREAPDEVRQLRAGHEKLATQMAENLKVLATARSVTEDILTDVANAVGASNRAKTYGTTGEVAPMSPATAARGIAVNRRL
jgi:hypothetical protein